MANKSIMLVCVMVSAAIFMAGAPKAEATISLFGGISIIQGTVFCTANGSIGVNGTATPVFPNAVVQLRCGANDQVVASATTNAQGAFTIVASNFQTIFFPLLAGCRVVVSTPLSACNATLPSTGRLVSTCITFINTIVNTIVQGLLTRISYYAILPFQFLAGISSNGINV